MARKKSVHAQKRCTCIFFKYFDPWLVESVDVEAVDAVFRSLKGEASSIKRRGMHQNHLI
jgi:hypothetical protein